MQVKLIPRGKRFVLPLDRKLMKALGLDEGAQVVLAIEGQKLLMKTASEARQKRFQRALSNPSVLRLLHS